MNLLTRIVLIFFLINTRAYTAPIANNDTASTSENTAIEIDVLSNDTGDAGLANTVNIKRPYRKGIFARRNGDVHFTPKLNAVGQESFQYTVRDATGAISSPGTVTVTVNGAPSDITLTNATVSENEAIGTLVGALASLDPNLPANPGDSHSYALVAGSGDTDNSLFQIIGDQLQTTALLNFESQANLNIRVRSTDAGNLFTEKNFTISVTDVNEVPNVAGASFNIAENSSSGTSVGNVTVSDPDASQNHSFSITGGNTNGAFTIDANNGSISVANNTALNFETTPIFTLTVQATDNGTPNLSNTATITIHLTDVNEAPDITPATFSIAENSSTGTSIGTVSAVDVDTGQSLTYAITAGNIGNAFAINQSTGEIVVNTRAALNFETTPSFSLTVEASDNGSPNLNSSAVITVNLSNVNEAPSANNDDAAVDEAGTVTVLTSSATQVSFNDSDPDVGDLLFVTTTPVIAPTHGVLTLNADGSFSYTHDGSETTSDSFVYEVCDSAPLCSNATVNIAINPVNDAPVASIPGTQTSDEDMVLVFDTANSNLLSISDDDAGINELSLTLAVSSGTLTLNSTTGLTFSVGDGSDDATMTLTGSLSDINNALDGMSFQPDLNSSGNSTLTLSVDDQGNTGSGGALTDSGSVTLTINAVNDAPENNAPVTQTINEDTTLVFNGANSNLISISDIDASSQSLLMTLSATNGNLTLSTISGLAFSSGDGTSDSTMSFTGSLSDINASLDGLSFQPDANAIGNATLSITTNDQGNIGSGGALSDTDTVSITINSINDAPTFAKGLDPVIILEDSGAQSVTGWASAIDDGDPETTQTLTFNITGNSNPSLFSVAPSIDASTGTLRYTPTANSNGSATITVELSDNGGTANGGIDTSSSQTFVINVTAVNDVPSFTKGADQTVNEDASLQTVSNWATAISAGPDNEASQTLTFQVGNNNNSLFSVQPAIDANGTLTYSPAANANGSATVTVSLQDSGGTSDGGVDTSATQTFTITVNTVNDAPSFLAGANQTVDEDAAAQNIIGWATAISDNDPEVVQGLAFVITNNTNSTLFSVAPSINATTGALTYTLAANAHGIATITAQLVDTGGTANGGVDTSPSQSFTITANPVNDAPLVTAPGPFDVTGNIAISIPAPGLLTTVSDPADGASAEPFTIKDASITSTNNGNVTVNTSTGAFTYNPPPGFTGADSFSYEVCDSGEPGSACTNATVDLNITGTIWFVDNNASTNGDGRLSSPFNSLSAFQTINDGTGNHPAAGDNVFLYESATAYVGPITLLNNQKLIGQDVTTDLVTAAGITLAPNSVAVPAMDSANITVVRVTNTTANTVAVGLSNSANATIRGLTLGNVLASGTAIGSLGAGFGTLTITDTSINTNGRALNLTSGTLAATFDSITSSASNNEGMAFTSVGGSMTVTGTTSASNSSSNGIALSSTTGNWNFGTVNASNTGGAGIVVSSGSAIIHFSSLDINNTVNQGVIVLNNASAVTINGGSIQNAGATDFEISGGTGNVTYAGTITDDVGVLVSVNGATAGTKTFSGAITDNNDGDGSGISLTNNTGAAINFTGGLTLSTGANAAFSATGGGTINITGAGNRITTTTSTALNVTNTNIGASGLTFQSINAGTASGSSGVGIYLDNTGISGANAGLTVTGNGTSASGGTIQHKTGTDGSTTAGIGIFLKDTKNASFSWMQLNDFDNGGILGRNVQGFSLQNSVLNGVIGTNSAANGDGPIYFGLSNPSGTNGLQGTGLIRNTKISGGIENNLEFYNQSGSMSLTIEGTNTVSEGGNANSAADDSADCIIEENTTGSGNDGILMEMQGTAAATIVIDRCLFRDNKSQPVQLAAIDNASIVATIDESWVRRFDHGNEGFIGSNGTNGDLTAMISNNHINSIDGTNIFVGQTPGNASTTAVLHATISGNEATQSSTATNHSILAFLTSTIGQISPARIRIDDNTVINNSTSGTTRGILIDTPDTSTTPSFDATVTNNRVAIGDSVNGVSGLVAQARKASETCTNLSENRVTFPNGTPSGVQGLRARQADIAGYDLQTSVSCTGTAATVLSCLNPNATTEVEGTINTVSPGTCLLPATP